jgi:DP-EP family
MAVEKKASIAKPGSKKPIVKKAVNKRPSPSLRIPIPKGGQVIKTFLLTPSLPVDGKAANWLLVEPTKPKKDIDGIHFSFSKKSTPLEREFERAIVQIKIQQNPNENGVWRFASDGVVVNPVFSQVNHDVVVEIIDSGFTLLAQVQSIDTTPENIRFGYLASFTDKQSGVVTVYESSDPDVRVGRP